MNPPRVLIIDDEPDIRELLEITLGRMKLDTEAVTTVAEAELQLKSGSFDLCLTDMNLPDGNGIELVQFIQQHCPQTPVAVITAYGSMDTAIASLKAGAFDFVSKPVELPRLRELVNQALKLSQSEKKASRIKMLGESAPIHKLKQQISRIARSQAPVYINGESGTGKEVVARMIHEQGPRGDQPFVAVNCGAIPSELMESEFFGHRKGSFTGAVNDKTGLFHAAHGGTLFLDEVADLPLHMQVKLLRAIQEKKIRPVGSQQEEAVDIRILSATHRDLAHEVQEERFRQDLFYRINVIELKVPPLKDRGEDILLLAEHFLNRLGDECDIEPPVLSQEANHALLHYSYPGNVRELENILERAFTLCENDTIMPADLYLNEEAQIQPEQDSATEQPQGERKHTPPPNFDSLEDYLEGLEKQAILQALETTRWNRTAAARQLGITFRALRYRLKKLNLDSPEHVAEAVAE
ncbi:sigma-54-dependent transcriptional regulator [Sansalvadorimonas verongulae]|uniref:sigma-54-dependent transcriptional regulator n=1 Tax=Sansalvadorimonas verongulae TaxID=2172824 RepID=UPI0012BC0577|nr:sigma-54 dependent transcriptional regulator [Sansalvadorimonas verongulae]MTI13463.1 sigma-54-dependent Fis family transcriptional regulator [Sansalvadorimonas verongulae]